MIKKIGLSLILLVGLAVNAQAACWQFSKTASNNGTADPSIDFSEGMAPSAVNDSARALMARLAECRDDLSGFNVTTGGAVAYVLASNQGTIPATPNNGQSIKARLNVTNGAASTLAVDGGTVFPIQTSPGVAVASGVLVAGTPFTFTFNSSQSAWILNGFYNSTIAAGSVVTSMLADANVTYAKIQNVTQGKMLGRYTASDGVIQEVTVSTGLNLNTSTGNLTAAYPPAGAFKNLVIKVASNTTVTVAADFVTTTNGTSFQTTAVSCTINMATTGINGLDTGAIASATWYYVWVDATASGTTGCTASLQSTANGTFTGNLPSTYTYYARVGAVRTAAGVAQLLGTWQFGRRAQYVVNLAQTTALPQIQAAATGSISVPTYTAVSVSSFVPTTASVIHLMMQSFTVNGIIMIAPNGSYGNINSTTNPAPVTSFYYGTSSAISSAQASLLLESSNIYIVINAGGIVGALGWEDNL